PLQLARIFFAPGARDTEKLPAASVGSLASRVYDPPGTGVPPSSTCSTVAVAVIPENGLRGPQTCLSATGEAKSVANSFGRARRPRRRRCRRRAAEGWWRVGGRGEHVPRAVALVVAGNAPLGQAPRAVCHTHIQKGAAGAARLLLRAGEAAHTHIRPPRPPP